MEGLKRGKSPGPDGLLAEHIRHGGSILIPWLTGVFNRILAVEEIPSCMKLGQIVPVYKRKGKDPASASSYRGITISSVFSKLFEVIILRRIDPVLFFFFFFFFL